MKPKFYIQDNWKEVLFLKLIDTGVSSEIASFISEIIENDLIFTRSSVSSEKQREIIDLISDNGEYYYGTLRKLAELLKIKSPQNVVHHLRQLEKFGFIKWDKDSKFILKK